MKRFPRSPGSSLTWKKISFDPSSGRINPYPRGSKKRTTPKTVVGCILSFLHSNVAFGELLRWINVNQSAGQLRGGNSARHLLVRTASGNETAVHKLNFKLRSYNL